MRIDTAGDYTLRYTATDSCGNTTTVDRELSVASPRTVLYTDGTFIINEAPADKAANEQLHGGATNVYSPFNPNGSTNVEKYIFNAQAEQLWASERSNIRTVTIGSAISPTSTAFWFFDCANCTNIDTSLLDTNSTTNMQSMFRGCAALTTLDLANYNTNFVTDMNTMFYGCGGLTTIDLTSFDTSSVTDMSSMFDICESLTVLDLSRFNTNLVTNMNRMFNICRSLTTIYASSDFVVTQVANSTDMFKWCNQLQGGAGTRWSSSNPKDKTYAHIDGGTSDPGYFTAKP